MKNGRRKGANFERALARDLREWLPDHEVVRNPTDFQAGKDGKAGEFSISGPFRFPFVIEAKFHASFKLAQLFHSPLRGPLPGWFAQACRQADAANLANGPGSVQFGSMQPLLIVKQSQYPVVAIMRPTASRRLVWCGRKPIMRLEVFSDSLEGEELSVWNWRTLTSIPSIRLAEIGR